MIVNNSALGFSRAISGCDCRFSEFALPVALADSTYWQVNIACNELTGTNRKLPCELNLIGPYTEDFKRYQDDTEEGLTPEYLISSTDIRFTEFQDGGNIFSTAPGFLEPNRCYWLRYTVSGYVEGFVQTVTNAGEGERTSGPNPARRANGTYSEIFCTDDQGRLRFQIGNDDTIEDLNTFILSNIFLGCIRYSELYELEISEGDTELVTFEGATKLCKQATTNSVLMSLREVPFIEGQTYKICFTISGSTAGSVDLLFNSTTPDTYTGNGFYCTQLEYEDATLSTQLQFELSTDFDGCIQDISVYLVADYRAELFDENGDEVQVGGESALQVEQIGNALKINLNPSTPAGCYSIGIADNCSNFMSQFYGNILDQTPYSEYLSADNYRPVIKTDNSYALQFAGWDDLPLGTHTFVNYFVIRESICYEKLYDMLFEMALEANGNTINTLSIAIYLAGDLQATGTAIAPGTTATFSFDDIIAGAESQDNCSGLGIASPTFCALVGKNAFLVEFTTEVVKANNTDPAIGFSTPESFVIMDQDTPQFCPEYFSVPLQVTAEAPCDTLLIKYRNPNNAFGFDYTSSGFTEADGFYNQMRIEGKLWKPNYPRVTEIQKASTGYRTNYYSDVDKKQTLTTGLLPEFVHDALSDAVGHETLIIEDQYFVGDIEEYAPSWEKSTELASVELELFVQQGRKLNTKC